MDMKMLENILRLPENHREALFKPKQQEVLRKVLKDRALDENQKRYLRGPIRRKLEAISYLMEQSNDGELKVFLDGIENYYITGYAALRSNGFGWYYDVKRMIVYNTRIQGTVRVLGASLRMVRLRSLRNRSFSIHPMTGLKYATNEQVLKDAREMEDEALVRECNSHLRRYGDLFIPGLGKNEQAPEGRYQENL